MGYWENRRIKENQTKKCPICNSSRFIKGSNGYKCKKCGYSNLREI